MAIITLAEAARLVGKSKPTLLRAHASGKLSMERNANNEWRVDTSELLRAYGQFVETQQDHDTKHDPSRRETGFLREIEAHNEKLERIIATLEMAVETHRETINDIRARLDESERERREATNTIKGLLTHSQPQKTQQRTAVTVLLAVLVVIIVALAVWRFLPLAT